MAEASPSPPATPVASTSAKNAIRELNVNDVLCGRGPGLAFYEGNLRFRELCDDRRLQYISTNKRRVKRKIAKEVLDIVHSKGGRFLKQDESGHARHCQGCVWHEIDEDVALEKAKQSLREIREPYSASPKKHETIVSKDSSESGNADIMENIPERISSAGAVEQTQIPVAPDHETQMPVTSVSETRVIPEDTTSTNDVDPLVDPSVSNVSAPFPPMPDESTSTGPSILDPRLLLFQNTASFAPQERLPAMTPGTLMSHLFHPNQLGSSGTESAVSSTAEMSQQEIIQNLVHSANVAAAASHQRYVAENTMYALVQNLALLHTAQVSSTTTSSQQSPAAQTQSSSGNECLAGKNNMEIDEEQNERRLSELSIDEELSAFLLSSLAVSDRPVVTEEQEEAELAALTDEEKASLYADTFGKMCEVYDAPLQKRARVDLDRAFIDFLVRQVRIEIDKIPMNDKMALVEARQSATCHSEEFSDRRLEQFLRCQGMDVRLAAQRFVRYWENRRDVFGPNKYLMRMTLSEALKDDVEALNTCVYTILPFQDVSGRTILFMQPRCHTREGYASESLVRCWSSEFCIHFSLLCYSPIRTLLA